MATIFVDGQEYEVDGSRNLLEVCLSLGMDLPYFCWHPAMGSVGACRQCAVKQFRNEEDEKGQVVMACMTPAADGTRISLADFPLPLVDQDLERERGVPENALKLARQIAARGFPAAGMKEGAERLAHGPD